MRWDVEPPARLLRLPQGRRDFLVDDVEGDVTHAVLVLLGVDAQVVDVEHGGALRQRQDDVLAAVHLEVVETSFLVRHLRLRVLKKFVKNLNDHFSHLPGICAVELQEDI